VEGGAGSYVDGQLGNRKQVLKTGRELGLKCPRVLDVVLRSRGKEQRQTHKRGAITKNKSGGKCNEEKRFLSFTIPISPRQCELQVIFARPPLRKTLASTLIP
jgi:hypothetical protein